VGLLVRAVRLKPDYVDAYHNLASVLTELRRWPEAAVWARQAVRLCFARGQGQGSGARGQEAGAWGQQDTSVPTHHTPLTTLHPLAASCYNQLGLALAGQARYRGAQAAYLAALQTNPGYAEAHSNLGNLFQEQGRLPEALAAYELALVHEPQSASTHWNRALSLLQAGDYAEGWREYEWRWQRPQTPPRPFRGPRWDGGPLEGRTLLIYMEQGLGDMLMFMRYARLAKERGGRVVMESPPGFVDLFGRCPGIDQVVAEGTALPPFDVQVPLMSLPGLLGTAVETVPADVPYLFADDALVREWGVKLQERLERPAVGHGARSGDRAPTGIGSWIRKHSAAGELASSWIRQNSAGCDLNSGESSYDPCQNELNSPDCSSLAPHPWPLTIGIVWQGNPRHGLDQYRSIPVVEFAPLARAGRAVGQLAAAGRPRTAPPTTGKVYRRGVARTGGQLVGHGGAGAEFGSDHCGGHGGVPSGGRTGETGVGAVVGGR
jgi:hypothetical protein